MVQKVCKTLQFPYRVSKKQGRVLPREFATKGYRGRGNVAVKLSVYRADRLCQSAISS